jgi:hypothetical protein
MDGEFANPHLQVLNRILVPKARLGNSSNPQLLQVVNAKMNLLQIPTRSNPTITFWTGYLQTSPCNLATSSVATWHLHASLLIQQKSR